MPQARTVGRVRPRPAAEDWFAVGFDPWSAGREPLRAEFVSTLSIKQVTTRANMPFFDRDHRLDRSSPMNLHAVHEM